MKKYKLLCWVPEYNKYVTYENYYYTSKYNKWLNREFNLDAIQIDDDSAMHALKRRLRADVFVALEHAYNGPGLYTVRIYNRPGFYALSVHGSRAQNI